jgi:2-methylcitrate dehydratase PrpD
VEAAADFGSGTDATIAGAGRASILGATFANAELLNAIDMDSILRLTHVTPYVVPPAMVATEIGGGSGADLIRGIVLGHEIAARVSGAYTALRGNETTGDGIATTTGYSSIIVGAAVAAGLPIHLERVRNRRLHGSRPGAWQVSPEQLWIVRQVYECRLAGCRRRDGGATRGARVYRGP